MRRYARVWSLPGARVLLVAGFIGRLPVAMVPLALLLLVEARTGSYAVAGLATAVYGVATAAVAPLLGRLADRIGPRPVLLASGVAYPAALVGLLVVLQSGTPNWAILVAAVVAGTAMPLVSSTVRAMWPRVTADIPTLQSAYALDAIAVECVFVLGPVLVAGFVTVTSPVVPVMIAALVALVGSVSVAFSAPARAWQAGSSTDSADSNSPLSSPGLRALLGSTAVVMLGLGCLEVAIPAYADQSGLAPMSGVLLAVWAMGSAVGGLWFGARHLQMSLPRQYRWGLLAIAIGFAPLAAAQNPWVLGVLLFLGGMAIAPTVSVQNALVAELAPARATTEAFTWLTTVVFGASAVGAALAGLIVDRPNGVPLALGIAAGTAFVAAAMAGVASRRLAPATA